MKKSVVILFLSVLVYNSIGFIINFHHALAEWRREVRVFLSQNNDGCNGLVRMSFQKSEFDASTDEFSKDDKRYDVVRTEILGDSLVVYCFQDDAEIQLITEFNELLLQNTTSKSDFEKKIKTIFKQLINEYVFENPFDLQPCPPSVLSGRKSILSDQIAYFPLADLDILTPPPQFVG